MLKKFLDYLLNERNRSEQTVMSYGKDLAAFEAYFKAFDERLSWDSADSDIIRDWMESMMDKGNAATSINRRLSAVHSLYRFAMSRGYVDHDPSRMVTGPTKAKPLPRFLKEGEMERLLDPSQWDETSYGDVCLHAILMTFYETGMRISELIGLDDSMVDLVQCEIKVHGKGNKQRIIPFGEELMRNLSIYVEMRGRMVGGTDAAFFKNRKGERLRCEKLRKDVKARLSAVSTMEKCSPHVLRHTFATAMLNHGAGIESVRKLLGHESLSTTEIYTHTTFEQLKRVYRNAHPRA